MYHVMGCNIVLCKVVLVCTLGSNIMLVSQHYAVKLYVLLGNYAIDVAFKYLTTL